MIGLITGASGLLRRAFCDIGDRDMTAQVGETLLINGEQHEMFNESLRFWFAL